MAEGTMPDFARCQAEIRDAHGAFRLGPRPEPKRCEEQSDYLVFEEKPGPDGFQGCMCLCRDCADVMFKQNGNKTNGYQYLDIHATAARYG